jgi:4-hydroxymandelate oxidase
MAVAPSTMQRALDPEGEVAMARGAAAGYRALVLTVDAPVLGRRWRDERNAFTLGDGVRAVNLDAALNERTHRQEAGASALAAHATEEFDQTLSWAHLDWLRAHTSLPIVLKGILTGADAARAVDCGVDAIIVSNHGGRQLDRVPATLSALPEVVAAGAGRCPVLVDGGVRDGGDVFAALALGASAALVGRPVLWSLCAEGADGVSGLLDSLREDLAHTMRLAGRPRLADIDADGIG